MKKKSIFFYFIAANMAIQLQQLIIFLLTFYTLPSDFLVTGHLYQKKLVLVASVENCQTDA
jgi:hypothetical protein